MKNKIVLLLFFMGVCSPFLVKSQGYEVIKSSAVYKNIDDARLSMDIYQPQSPEGIKLPAIVFFFGGGWVGGTPDHFKLQAEYFASRGMVAVCPDYRTQNRHGTTPFESVKDARSAMRFLKKNGHKFGIDTSRIVASGGSAGGHLAACTALIDDVNESTDDLFFSPVPYALVLFNPVVDTGKLGYGYEKVKGREFEISPVHHITKGVPPTLIMHGKDDKTVPYENVVRFSHAMKQQENRCILKGYKKQEHGFFNYSRNPEYFKKTLRETESFLDEMNLLKGKSWVNQFIQAIPE
ncbi:alpha/beta hydrolase [Mariniphaga sp.]|uniref:alpha/beta hydrolase n=1 Tax=Mariniphaga sp. TaxID=1954475 RepID=UPI003561334F